MLFRCLALILETPIRILTNIYKIVDQKVNEEFERRAKVKMED